MLIVDCKEHCEFVSRAMYLTISATVRKNVF